jgi:hypothetical protein
MKYSDKLRDPRWQKKRLEIFERDGFACQSCGDNTEMLCVHHLYYEKGKEPWEYENEALLTLCNPCHEVETIEIKRCEQQLIAVLASKRFLSSQLISLAAGFHCLKMFHAPEVVASIIEFALETPEIMDLLSDLFFKDLRKRVEEKEVKNGKK